MCLCISGEFHYTPVEIEGGKWLVFSVEQWSSYHRGRGRDCPIRDERWPDHREYEQNMGGKNQNHVDG